MRRASRVRVLAVGVCSAALLVAGCTGSGSDAVPPEDDSAGGAQVDTTCGATSTLEVSVYLKPVRVEDPPIDGSLSLAQSADGDRCASVFVWAEPDGGYLVTGVHYAARSGDTHYVEDLDAETYTDWVALPVSGCVEVTATLTVAPVGDMGGKALRYRAVDRSDDC